MKRKEIPMEAKDIVVGNVYWHAELKTWLKVLSEPVAVWTGRMEVEAECLEDFDCYRKGETVKVDVLNLRDRYTKVGELVEMLSRRDPEEGVDYTLKFLGVHKMEGGTW